MRTWAWMAGAALASALGACDGGTSAVETRDRTPEVAAADAAASAAPASATEAATPMVTANRRETADAKVQRLFERNGEAFGARTAEDYGERMRAFVDSPPSGTDTATRPNGDTLMYHAASNTFAVADRSGTPRTMFKPDDGPTYWAEQKERAPTFGRRRAADAGG